MNTRQSHFKSTGVA